MSDEPEAVKERASPASITTLFPDNSSKVPPTGTGALGIADALNNRGVKTYKDRAWYPTTVKNVLEREAA